MQFDAGNRRRGPLMKGIPDGWEWSAKGGNYDSGADFFSVHWEVHDHDPLSVRLHVEAPRYAIDPDLNVIKQRVIAALLASNPSGLVNGYGFGYKDGTRRSDLAIRKNKSTEPFRVLLKDNQRSSTANDITRVHTAIGDHVTKVLEPFVAELRQRFRP